MTGNHHRPDCTCGWCLYSERNHGVHKGLTFGEAKLLLKNYGVTSRSSCFVMPNARCPVCQGSVYYYTNDHGSRVFFDHLGPPWPKHPCTDNPKLPMAKFFSPILRDPALAERLLMSLQLVGNPEGTLPNYSSHGWKVLQIVRRILDGQNGTIITRQVGPRDGGENTFNYASSHANFEIGDLLYLKDEEVQYFDRKTLSTREFRSPLNDTKLITGSALSGQSEKRLVSQKEPLKPGNRSQPTAMNNQNVFDFPKEAKELEIFLQRLGAIIASYRFRGIKGANKVAARLNREGYRTFKSNLWTPQLVNTLFGLLISRKAARRKGRKASPFQPTSEGQHKT